MPVMTRLFTALVVGAVVVAGFLLLVPGRLDPESSPARDAAEERANAAVVAEPARNSPAGLERPDSSARAAGNAASAPNLTAPETPASIRGNSADAAAPAIEGPAVRGRVVDAETGASIPRFELDGVLVDAQDGRFAHAGRLGFTIEARGYRAWSCSDVDAVELARAEVLVGLARDPDVGSISILVRDDAGAPIADVELAALHPVRVSERTDARGRCELAELPPRGFELSLRAEGWSEARVDVLVEPRARTERLVVLRRSQPIALRVLDEEGRPSHTASLRVECRDEARRAGRWRPAHPRPDELDGVPFRTDDDGALALDGAEGRIEGLAPGRYVLHVVENGGTHRLAPLHRAVPFELGGAPPAELVVRFDEPAPR